MENSTEVFFDINQVTEIIPVSRHTFRDGATKKKHYPPPVIGEFNRHFWKKSDIELLIRLIAEGIWNPESIWDDLIETRQVH
jgi:hypothetical protein